jgi:outer membrane protein assembly factor BamB/tetratricopeptide (TPR) repeat protein
LEKAVSPAERARGLAFHPVIVGGRVLVADARSVTAYDVATGDRRVWDLGRELGCPVYGPRERRAGDPPGLTVTSPPPPDLRYTLTAADGLVYARLGAQAVTAGPKGSGADSYLVCLEVAGAAGRPRLRWSKKLAAGSDGPRAAFEGAPVVRDDRVYVAVTRFANNEEVTAVHCYAAGMESNAPPRWAQDVFARRSGPTAPRYRHRLLTLAGPYVVCGSQAGAVVALDALTGRRAWAVRYPSGSVTTRGGFPVARDLDPAVYADGRLYVAPADSDRLLCLDPWTGATLWERALPPDGVAVHLLGVGSGRLIFTTPTGIRAVRAADGGDAGGWVQPDVGDDGGLPSWGRGFLAGKWVFWPTTGGVKVLSQEDGRQPDDLIPLSPEALPPGNLAYAGGCLAVAGERELSVYLSPGRLLPQREKDAQEHPDVALERYRLAVAEADAGLFDRADADFRRAAELASGRGPGGSLQERAVAGRHELLLNRAAQAQAGGNPDEAAALLDRAAAAEFPAAARAEALARRAAVAESADDPGRAAQAWQAILADGDLRRAPLRDVRGLPQCAAAVAAEHLAWMGRRHGGAASAEVEKRARALLEGARGQQASALLERVAAECPTAPAAGPALLRLARFYEEAGRWGAAAHACRRLLARPGPSADRPAALAALARAYEHQGCWDGARAAWQVLAREEGDHAVAAVAPARPVRDFVAEQLRKPGYGPAVASALALPLVRAWETHAAEERFLPLAHGPPGPARAALFFARGRALVCRDATAGKERWARPLPLSPSWVACHNDIVIAAGPEALAGLSLQDGRLLWEVHAPPGPPLSGFRLAGPRLFFLQGGSRLLALDVEAGRTLWDHRAPLAQLDTSLPAGHFSPHYLAGDEWVLVQTSGRCQALEAATGRLLQEAETGEELWWEPPRALGGDRVCWAHEPRDVVACDLAAGRLLWRYALPRPTSLTGDPARVVGGAEALCVFIPRNYGTALQRLDPESGQPLWREEVLLGLDRIPAASVALDRERICYAADGALSARALADGRLLWSYPLPRSSGLWHLTRTSSALVACPAEARRTKFHFCWLGAALELTVTQPPEDRPGSGLPVLLLDPQSGRVVERLNLTAPRPRAEGQRHRAAGWEVMPELRLEGEPAAGPVVRLTRPGLVVGWEGTTWALRQDN